MVTTAAAMPRKVIIMTVRDSQPLRALPMTRWLAAIRLMNHISWTAMMP